MPPCNNKTCNTTCNNAYAYICAVGQDGLASGYANGYSDRYNLAAALISNNNNLQGYNNNWELEKKLIMTMTMTIIMVITNGKLTAV